MIGYDLDDTLAGVDFALARTRGLANVYRSAKVLLTPSEPFIVITARTVPSDAEKKATTEWLKEHQPNFKAIYYVSGTEEQVIQKKASAITRYKLTDYYDNNQTIVDKLRELTRAKIHKV